MKKHLKAIISVAIALPIVLYATGLLAQLIININTWKQAGSNYRVSPGLPSLSLMMNLKALVDFPENLIAFAIIIVGLFIFFVFGLRIGWGSHGIPDADRNLTVSGSGSYGTASFMSVKESEHCFEITTARRTSQDILGMTEDGKVLTLPPNTRLNSNLAVCGASGTGKSRSISRNLIFQAAKRGESIIVTDPKSELYESMSRYLRDQGYEVRVFNLVQMDHSDSWNCLGEVGNSELLAQTFADVVLQNTSGDQRDPFWYNAELNLLKALVLYVALELPPAQRNLGTVYDLLCNESERSLSVIMESIRHEHTNKFTGEVLPPSPASAPFAIFKQSSETVRTSVIIGLGSKLQIMQSKEVRNITSYPEIDLELPGKKKCAYFCIVSDQDRTFDFLSSLFFSFLFIKLIRYADGYCEGGVLNPKVKFILDEFPNCCLIPDFTKKCSTIRSRGCSVAVFFQNVGQMKNRYPDDQWQEILGACDSTVFLGCTDSGGSQAGGSSGGSETFYPQETGAFTVDYGGEPIAVEYTPELTLADMLRDDGSIGTVTISSVGMDVKVYEGATTESMAKGAGHYETTSLWDGNVGLFGHNRGSHPHFKQLKSVEVGDIVTYETNQGIRTYQVVFVGTISYTDHTYLNEMGDNRITLTTCIADQPSLRLCVQAVEII